MSGRTVFSLGKTYHPKGHATRARRAFGPPQQPDALIALACAAVSLILYAATAAPSVATLFDDSLEFQVVLPALGIAHPSGYPLYTFLGKLFSLLLPFRDPAGRVNLLSAVAAGAAIGVFYLVARRLARHRLAAMVATIALAISPTWWSQATIAEVYALHGLILTLFLYLLLRWEATTRTEKSPRAPASSQPSAALQPSASHPWLSAVAITFGLGLTHHRMIALMLPAALVFILWTDPSLLRRPRWCLRPILLGAAPLLLYLYLPIRGRAVGSLDGMYEATLTGTVNWILARDYSVFLTGNPFGVSRGAAFFLDLFLREFGVPLPLMALVGLATAWRTWPRRYVFLLLATAAQVTFGLAYKVQDVAVFFIPAFLLTALWAAWGITWVLGRGTVWLKWLGQPRLHAANMRGMSCLAASVLAALLLAQPIITAVRTFPEQDRSRDWQVYDYGQDMLDSIEPGGRVVGLLGETTLLRYFRDVLGQRPDVSLVPADDEGTRLAAVDAALAAGIPVYLTRDLPGAAGRYSLDAAGPLIAVSPKASLSPAQRGQPVAENILLVDAVAREHDTHTGLVVRLTLTWSAIAPIRDELKISARLLDSAGKVVAANDQAPVHFTYPTTAWVPGELVADVYDLALGPAEGAGSYRALVILYRVSDGGEVGRIELPAVIVG